MKRMPLNSYRYITAELVVTGLCSPSEISRALGVSSRNIQRYAKALREQGPEWFFNREEKRGRAHKLTDDVLKEAQQLIDKFYSVKDVAMLIGVTEGALRYHIKKGNIKKKMETLSTPLRSPRKQAQPPLRHATGKMSLFPKLLA
jgi:predicted transcriptional regulator